jgi:transposase
VAPRRGGPYVTAAEDPCPRCGGTGIEEPRNEDGYDFCSRCGWRPEVES